MTQTSLSDHIDKGQVIELCPQCFKPLTPYWGTILIEPCEDSNMAVLTMERKCRHCGYTEQEEKEQVLNCGPDCDKCVAKCRGGC